MRKILIIGAGQAGLHLGHGLVAAGYDVTLVSAESSTDIRHKRPHVAQFTMPAARGLEQALDLEFWGADAPEIFGATLHLYPPQGAAVSFSGAFDGPATSVDRRAKMADWLESLEDRGATVVVQGVTVTDLEYFARMFDLVVVAVGHGELGELFSENVGSSAMARPRIIAQALLDDVARGDERAIVASSPQARVILAPTLTPHGLCHALFIVEDANAGTIDAWASRPRPTEQLDLMRDLLSKHAPAVYEAVADATPIDGLSTTVQTIRPHVRHPVGRLPSGGTVLGMGDVVISLDPIACQGWSVSTMAATAYLDRIVAHADRLFDTAWMADTFATFWSGPGNGTYAGAGRASATLAAALDGMWSPSAPAHLGEIVTAASTHPAVANRFIGDLIDPRRYESWLYDPDAARGFIRQVARQ